MPSSATVQGLEKLLAQLKAKEQQYGKPVDVVVGYRAGYALAVHEDRERRHKVGRAGYLLDVARELSKDVARIIIDGIKSGMSVREAFIKGGLFLQRNSQENCPVLTGNLKNSAFTELEEG